VPARLAPLAIVASLVALAVGCGGSNSASNATTVTETVTADTSGGAAQSAQCGAEVDTLLRELRGLQSRIRVGIRIDAWTDKLGDIAEADGQIQTSGTSQNCRNAVGKARGGFLWLRRLRGYWASCLNYDSCNDPAGQANRAKVLARATALISEAERLAQA
jgi:hypothetical protein